MASAVPRNTWLGRVSPQTFVHGERQACGGNETLRGLHLHPVVEGGRAEPRSFLEQSAEWPPSFHTSQAASLSPCKAKGKRTETHITEGLWQ